jgi:hypothetical protein
MEISNKLPQFENNPTLIIMASWQSGKVYYAYNGKIILDKEIEITEEHKDQEGYFEVSTGKNKNIIRSSAPHDNKKEHIRNKFLKEFSEYIKDVLQKNKIQSIYVFSLKEGLKGLKKIFPNNVSKIIVKYYSGNYTHQNPEDFLEIIKHKDKRPVKIMKEEAKKILDRTKNIFRKNK